MFIRVFLYANEENKAKEILELLLSKLSPIYKSYTVLEIKPYWKMEDVYKVEINVILSREMLEIELDKILLTISDKWLKFENPPSEYLASDTTEDCTYILSGIQMININLEQE